MGVRKFALSPAETIASATERSYRSVGRARMNALISQLNVSFSKIFDASKSSAHSGGIHGRPRFARLSYVAGEQDEVADIHPAFSHAFSASALMECAGRFLNNSSSSGLEAPIRFAQPRSYLSSHQRLIANATCGKSLSSLLGPGRSGCRGARLAVRHVLVTRSQ
jgi:hypothetical protein